MCKYIGGWTYLKEGQSVVKNGKIHYIDTDSIKEHTNMDKESLNSVYGKITMNNNLRRQLNRITVWAIAGTVLSVVNTVILLYLLSK